MLSVCFSVVSGCVPVLIRELILSITLNDLKKSICTSLYPSLEEIKTKVVESGQKRRIKTPGVNGYVSLVYL